MGNPIDKQRQYLDKDVYQMAKERIKHVLITFDSYLVSFSGGKDSLAVLNLVQECYDELGIKEKVKVVFRDEELIPDSVIDFVQGIYKSGKYDFRYYAVPLESNKFVLGKVFNYIQFDPNREWVRNPPEYAIRLKEGDNRVFSQYNIDGFVSEREKGKVAIFTGIRADESLVRYNSIKGKKNEPFICNSSEKRVKLVRPIYDWNQKDVFLYFFKNNIKYCPIYDIESINGEALRVSTPLHSEAAKRFDMIKTRDPDFYERLVKVFPEMIIQEKYWKQMSNECSFSKYDRSFLGLLNYIDNEITEPTQNKLAKKRVTQAWGTRKRKLQGASNLGGVSTSISI